MKGEVGSSGTDGESVTWVGSYDFTALYEKNSIVVLEMNATITAAILLMSKKMQVTYIFQHK